jgi:hypothetical protein
MNDKLASKWNIDTNRYLTRWDFFGVKVGLAYNKSPTHSTKIGKFASLLLYVYMFYYGLQTVLPVIRGETKTLTSEVKRVNMTDAFNPGTAGSGFNLAFGFLEPPINMEKYGTFTYKLVTKDGEKKETSKAMTSKPCSDVFEKLKSDEKADFERLLAGHKELLNLQCSTDAFNN